MKKITLLFLSIVCICCFVFGLTACNNNNKTDSSSIQSNTTNSENSGSQGQELSSSSQGQSSEDSSSSGGGEVPPTVKHEHKYGEWVYDETNHWKECKEANGECDAQKVELGKHSLDSNTSICTVCGQTIIEGQLSFSEIKEGENVVAYSVSEATPKNATFVNIPAEYNGKPVTGIEESVFKNYANLIKITIPNSVTSIGNNAFYNCTSLTSVNITDLSAWCKIKFDEYTANPFYYADNLYLNGKLVTDLDIPNDVTSIGKYAFHKCDSLQSVTIPNSVTSISEDAFSYCKYLTCVTLGSGVTYIDYNSFEGCGKLVEVYNLSSLKITKGDDRYGYVGYYALGVYTSKDTPSKLSTTKDGYIFYENGEEVYLVGYIGKETNLVLPDKFNNKNYAINKLAFSNDQNIKSITIPNSVTSIGNDAFANCGELISVTMENGVTSIGQSAFYGCNSLISIVLPNSVTSIGQSAFEECCKLVEVYNLSSLNVTKGSKGNGWLGYYALDVYTSLDTPSKLSTTKDGFVFYENGEEVYFVSYVGNETNLVLPDKFNNKNYAINKYAFSYCNKIKSVILPNSVKSIGDYTFFKCSSLTNVTIGSGVTSIGEYAFFACDSLSSITFVDTANWNGSDGVFDRTIEVTDPSANVSNFRNYFNYVWKKNA